MLTTAAQRVRLTFAGEELAAVSTFTYPGTRCAEPGVESGAVQQQLFTTMVTPILTYGVEVWAPQLIPPAARKSHTGGEQT